MLRRCEISPGGPLPPQARAGMATKLVAAREALLGGVADVVVADGRIDEPVLSALAGGGTRISLSPRPGGSRQAPPGAVEVPA